MKIIEIIRVINKNGTVVEVNFYKTLSPPEYNLQLQPFYQVEKLDNQLQTHPNSLLGTTLNQKLGGKGKKFKVRLSKIKSSKMIWSMHFKWD